MLYFLLNNLYFAADNTRKIAKHSEIGRHEAIRQLRVMRNYINSIRILIWEHNQPASMSIELAHYTAHTNPKYRNIYSQLEPNNDYIPNETNPDNL